MSVKRILEDTYFEGRVSFNTLPDEYYSETKGSTEVDVSNIRNLLCKNTGAQNVDDLFGGASFQMLVVRGDGFTTFTVAGNIITNTGAAKLLSADKVYRFTYYADTLKWVEDG
jgi:hypothetical protein